MKGHFLGLVVLLFVMEVLALTSNVCLVAAESATIVVPDDFLTIQEAINSAVDEETIFVKTGTYYEHVVINKTVSLVGEDSSTTIIDGNGTGDVISIINDNVKVTGFTVQRGGSIMFPVFDAGIGLNSTRGCEISSNNIIDNGCFGIHMLDSDQNTISGNNLTRNTWYAIDLTTSSDNIISSNLVIFNPKIGIGMHASSQNNTISENTVMNNTYGIDAARVRSNTISGNHLADNSEIGIWIQDDAIDNTIYGNYVTDSRYCIKIEEQANSNTVSGNNIINNNYGIWFYNSYSNWIYHNNFIDNTFQTSIVGYSYANSWDDGYPSGGNYWSDYYGTDIYSGLYQNETGSDGIGDTPYVIDDNNQDNYPLMKPSNPLFGDMNYDFRIDMRDIAVAAWALGSYPTHPRWNNQADLNQDDKINMKDLVIIARNFGKTYF